MFDKLYAVVLLVEDFDTSLSFYRDVLDLKLNTQDNEGRFAEFTLHGISLAIYQKDSATAMFPKRYMNSPGGILLAFQVEDVESACEELTNKGVSIIEGPKVTNWGQKVAYFTDPEGNVWEISEPLTEV